MGEDSYWHHLEECQARARDRVDAGRPMGVAYVGPARRDPRGEPQAGWRGVIVATDGVSFHEMLVVARAVSRHAKVNEEAW